MSAVFKACLDCRLYTRKSQSKSNARVKASVAEGQFHCSRCGLNQDIARQAVKENGDLSKRCRACFEETADDKSQRRRDAVIFKFNYMAQLGASCEECRCIIVRDPVDSSKPLVLQTVAGHVIFENNEYDVKEFFSKFSDIILLEVVDFDHLSEVDQRDRGKLAPDEPYVKKVIKMSAILSDNDRRLESRKCQICCGKCHVRKTIAERKHAGEQGPSTIAKQEYLNGEKLRLGCENCGEKYPELLQFLEFSHIDTVKKVDALSNMCYSKSYTLDDVVKARGNCRVLCKYCNRIHVKQGKLFKKRKVHPK